MKKVLLLISVMILAICQLGAEGLTDMSGMALKNVKIPFYKNKKLQLVTFSESGKRIDQLMNSSNTFLDVLLETADVDRIADGWFEQLYPLQADLPTVLKFWKKRFNTSKAVIFTSSCTIDQTNGEASGDDPVFLRSPMLDLDGVGFHANFNANTIDVNSEVKIVTRKSDADPRKIHTGTPAPAVYERIHATSDSLRMDMDNNELMLIGNVRVIDGKSTLTCDRLTIFLEEDSSTEQQKKSSDPMLKGVSRVLADGEVLLIRQPDDPAAKNQVQSAVGDHLEYDLKTGIIALSSDNGQPSVQQGSSDRLCGDRIEILRNENKIFATGKCRVRAANTGDTGSRIITSDRADFDGNKSIANFNGNVVAVDKNSTLYCENMRVHLTNDGNGRQKVEKILADKQVKIVNRTEKKGTPAVSTITSAVAELNYATDKIIFYEQVKLRDGDSMLDCDRLDLFMTDKSATAANNRNPGTLGSNSKSITKAIASGHVYMRNKADDLSTELMTLFFRELPPGSKPSPGMFQSGGVQLVKILCDGSVVANSNSTDKATGKKELRRLKAQHAMSDLLKDYSEFHGNVVVYNGSNELYCRDMYVFTARTSAAEKPAAAVPVAVAAALDDDPFALDMGENSAPSRIALSDSHDLSRIVCKNEVVIVTRSESGRVQRAGGDLAIYQVATKELQLTATPPRRPWLRSDGRKQFCDVIRGDMATEELRGSGNVQVMPDNGI